jgi:nicotinamide-nucleotide amidase
MDARDLLTEAAASLLDDCRRAGIHVATAESCTGGLIAAYLTEIPGSSDVFERGFVTYSNEAKQDLLSVPPDLLQKHGAVSPHVARAMAVGAIAHSRADVAVSVTGIAGPEGGTPTKPVGLVYLAACRRGGEPMVERHSFSGDRHAIRQASVEAAFLLLRAQLPS